MFVPSLLRVGEGDGTIQVCATLSIIEDLERNIAIAITTSDNTGMCISILLFVANSSICNVITAIADYDFLRTSSNEVFTSGSTNNSMRCSVISIIDDDALEGNQTFRVTLSTLDPNVMLGNSITTVTIMDNDG